MTSRRLLSLVSLPLLALCFGAQQKAHASTYTASGTFTTDNQAFFYNFTSTSTETLDFYTTSYGGGANLNGTMSMAGGFVPVLTLFSASGNPLGFAGGSGMCSGSADGGHRRPGSATTRPFRKRSRRAATSSRSPSSRTSPSTSSLTASSSPRIRTQPAPRAVRAAERFFRVTSRPACNATATTA